MELERFERAQDFYERAERYLLRHETCHSLILGIAGQLVEHPELFRAKPYLATVEEGGEVVAAALMTPPFGPVLSLGFTPQRVRLLAEDLQELYPTLPGVLGPLDAARSFAGIWEDLSGQSYRTKRADRVHQLERVIPVEEVPGKLRQATEADRELLLEWFVAFSKEALGEDTDPEAASRSVESYLATKGMGLYLWENEEPVSMAGHSRPTPNGVTVNYVYTTPEYRRGDYEIRSVPSMLGEHSLPGGVMPKEGFEKHYKKADP
jgi:predicted GNAT family acetyltransferase